MRHIPLKVPCIARRSHASITEAAARPDNDEELSPSRDRKLYGAQRQNPWSGASVVDLLRETKRLEEYVQKVGGEPKEKLLQQNAAGKVIRLDDYFDVLEAWMEHAKKGESNSLEMAQRAEQLLERLHLYGKQNFDGMLAPTRSFFEVVLHAYAVCDGGAVAAQRAQNLLYYMTTQPSSLQPLRKTYHIVINAWAKSKTPEAGHKADEILNWMLKDESQQHYFPSHATITTVMDAWSQSGHPEAEQRVTDMLQRTLQPWLEQQKSGGSSSSGTSNLAPIAPSMPMFHIAMDTIIKASSGKEINTSFHGARQAAQRVEDMLQFILHHRHTLNLQPNVLTYSIVLDAWARVEFFEQSGEAAKRAQRILDSMLKAYYGGANHNSPVAPVRPNAVSFTIVITAWTRANRAQMAQDTFQRLLQLFQATNGIGPEAEDTLPTIIVGNALMSAWARERRPDCILQVLKTMEKLHEQTGRQECQPDLMSFNILLNAFGKSGQPEDALSLLQWMEGNDNARHTIFHQTLVRPEKMILPDIVSYNTVISAFAQQGYARPVENLLTQLKLRNDGVGPDKVTYSNVLIAYARCSEPDRFERSCQIWKEYCAMGTPDVVCRGAFIQACAYASRADKEEALKTALEAFAELPMIQRNHVIYFIAAKAINQLLVWHENDGENQMVSTSSTVNKTSSVFHSKESIVEGRKALLKEICEQCCKGGHLSQNVHEQLSRARWNSEDVVLVWLGCKKFDPQWSHNVPGPKKPKALMESKQRQNKTR
jgi:pentatricopeptide repeat protein